MSVCTNCNRGAGECAALGSQDCWRAKCASLQMQLDAAKDDYLPPPQGHDGESVVVRDSLKGLTSLESWFVGALHTYRESQEKPLRPMLPIKYQILGVNLGWLLTLARQAIEPVSIAALYCPVCKTRHIDEGEFATKRHHTHACQGYVDDNGKRRRCGHVWRPALVPTVGVEALPGFINEEIKPDGV